MSDALQRTPSFNEMVQLIEKLFKDSLEMTKAFTAEEIEQGWQRYKTLNHLYQDECSSIWVKASNRLPGWTHRVKWRNGNDERFCSAMLLHYALPVSFIDWKWLDESIPTIASNEIITALQTFVSRHEAGLLPDRFVYEQAKKALEGK